MMSGASRVSRRTRPRSSAFPVQQPQPSARTCAAGLMLCCRPSRRRHRRHRLDALALARHHQAEAIISQWAGAVRVTTGGRRGTSYRVGFDNPPIASTDTASEAIGRRANVNSRLSWNAWPMAS